MSLLAWSGAGSIAGRRELADIVGAEAAAGMYATMNDAQIDAFVAQKRAAMMATVSGISGDNWLGGLVKGAAGVIGGAVAGPVGAAVGSGVAGWITGKLGGSGGTTTGTSAPVFIPPPTTGGFGGGTVVGTGVGTMGIVGTGVRTSGLVGAVGGLVGRAGGAVGKAAGNKKVRGVVGGILGWWLVDKLTGAILGQTTPPRRHMNVLNPRALTRANKRLCGFRDLAKRSLGELGYRVERAGSGRSCKPKKRGCR